MWFRQHGDRYRAYWIQPQNHGLLRHSSWHESRLFRLRLVAQYVLYLWFSKYAWFLTFRSLHEVRRTHSLWRHNRYSTDRALFSVHNETILSSYKSTSYNGLRQEQETTSWVLSEYHQSVDHGSAYRAGRILWLYRDPTHRFNHFFSHNFGHQMNISKGLTNVRVPHHLLNNFQFSAIFSEPGGTCMP